MENKHRLFAGCANTSGSRQVRVEVYFEDRLHAAVSTCHPGTWIQGYKAGAGIETIVKDGELYDVDSLGFQWVFKITGGICTPAH